MKIANKAFTLVEILVTIGIIALLLAAAIPSFNKYSRVNEFHQVAQTLKTAIETTKNYALAPRLEKIPGEDIYGIRIEKVGNGFKYQIYEGNINTVIEERLFLKDNLTLIDPSGNNIDIQFSISQKAKIVSPNITKITMQLTNPDVPSPDNIINLTVSKDTGRVDTYGSEK